MPRAIAILLLGAFFLAASAQAGQLYRWVDGAGRVHYSDQPPPASVKEVRDLSSKRKSGAEAAPQASSDADQPQGDAGVTLYANDCGPVCDKAVDYLRQRGIAYVRKDPAKDPEAARALRKLTGLNEVPVIVVGKTHQKGFDASSWGSLLDAAGYPKNANP